MAFLLLACDGQPFEERRLVGRPDPFSKEEARRGDAFRSDSAYIQNSCAFDFEQGHEISRIAAVSVRSPYFAKPLDTAALEAVGLASARATVARMGEHGVAVYRVPLQAGSCALFEKVPEVPDGLWRIWAPINLGFGGALLGLFLPAYRLGPNEQREAILLRADTDRYTLIHEYVHYLYEQVRRQRSESDPQMSAKFRSRVSRLAAVTPLTSADRESAARVSEVARAWSDLAEVSIFYLDHYALEEMAVETLLDDLHRRGRLGFVTEYSRKNGAFYVAGSWQRAKDLLLELRGERGDLHTLAAKHHQPELAARVRELSSKIDSRLEEGERLAARANPRMDVLARLHSRHGSPRRTDCGHDRFHLEL